MVLESVLADSLLVLDAFVLGSDVVHNTDTVNGFVVLDYIVLDAGVVGDPVVVGNV